MMVRIRVRKRSSFVAKVSVQNYYALSVSKAMKNKIVSSLELNYFIFPSLPPSNRSVPLK